MNPALRNMTEQMTLNEAGSTAVRKSLEDGAVTHAYGQHRENIIKLLNDPLATELVFVPRSKSHHSLANGLASPKLAEEFMVHANEKSNHADRFTKKIGQLGGKPDFSHSLLLERSHPDYDESNDTKIMIRVSRVAERLAVETYRQTITLIGGIASTSRRCWKTCRQIKRNMPTIWPTDWKTEFIYIFTRMPLVWCRWRAGSLNFAPLSINQL